MKKTKLIFEDKEIENTLYKEALETSIPLLINAHKKCRNIKPNIKGFITMDNGDVYKLSFKKIKT